MKMKSTKKPIILLVGPLPPLPGGIATAVSDLLRFNLVKDFKLIHSDNPTRRSADKRGVRGKGTLKGDRKYYYLLPPYNEGLSYGILEAMAAGIPGLVTSVESNPEVVTDGEDGLVVPPKDLQILAQGIKALLNNPEEEVE